MLTPWKEGYTNLDSILKSRDLTLPTKVCIVKAMVSPVVMYGCESWIVNKAEGQRIDAFELWCWRRLQDGQGALMCCSPWGRKELDTTEWLNWTELKYSCWFGRSSPRINAHPQCKVQSSHWWEESRGEILHLNFSCLPTYVYVCAT